MNTEDLKTNNTKQKSCHFRDRIFALAGKAGFEPTNDGVKVRCLTAWLLPNNSISIPHFQIMSTQFMWDVLTAPHDMS